MVVCFPFLSAALPCHTLLWNDNYPSLKDFHERLLKSLSVTLYNSQLLLQLHVVWFLFSQCLEFQSHWMVEIPQLQEREDQQ